MSSNFYDTGAKSLFTFDITDKYGKEYTIVINDTLRMLVVQICIQFMLVVVESDKYSFFSHDFLAILLYMIVGVSFYWLVFRKIVSVA